MKDKTEPAFPLPQYSEASGLTKREYFAGLAMQGMIQSHTLNLSKEEARVIAGQSIQFADELLKQLGE